MLIDGHLCLKSLDSPLPHTHTHTHTYRHMCACVRTRVRVCMYVCMYVDPNATDMSRNAKHKQ